jgi:hypothetical protein
MEGSKQRRRKKKGPVPKLMRKMEIELAKGLNDRKVISWNTKPETSTVTCEQGEQPASSRKILGLDDLLGNEGKVEEEGQTYTAESMRSPNGFRFFDIGQLQTTVSEVAACKVCGGELFLEENPNKRQGFASCIVWKCTNASCPMVSEHYTSKQAGQNFEINRTAVIGFHTC